MRDSLVVVYLILFSSSCLLALFITPLLRWLAVRNDILDYPNENRRKIHEKAVPRVGGISIAFSFLIPASIGYLLFRSEIQESRTFLISFFVGAVMILFLGTWDDLRGVNAPRKLAGQVAAILVMIPFGFVIRELNIPFAGVVEVGWPLGVLLALFWIVGITNTINFIDGMDGLAAGTSVTISLALFVISVLTNQLFMAFICIALAGSTLGFLRYNFHPATIFMGDCGAMFLGFALAVVSIRILFQNTSIAASSFIPILIFGLPIVDTSWAIVRRLGRRESPLRADSFHTHHRLINLGLKQSVAAVILYASSLLSVSAGIIIVLTGSENMAIILSVFMLALSITGITILRRTSPIPGASGHESVKSDTSSRLFARKPYKKLER